MMLFVQNKYLDLARFYGKRKLETTTQTEKQICLLFLRYRIVWKTVRPVLQHNLEYKARKLP